MKSRFAQVFETRKKIEEAEQEPESETTPAPLTTPESKPGSKKTVKKTSAARRKPKPPPIQPVKRGVGRPPGKRSSEDYQSVTTFIRSDTYYDVTIAILEDKKKHGIKRDFGDLVEELLAEWLKRRKQ